MILETPRRLHAAKMKPLVVRPSGESRGLRGCDVTQAGDLFSRGDVLRMRKPANPGAFFGWRAPRDRFAVTACLARS